MKSQNVKILVHIAAFAAVLVILFMAVQDLLTPEWIYPSFSEAPGDMMSEFYELTDKVKFQAVFLEASGYEWDIDPMKIYKDTGIVTFNMSSSGQPFPVSYFLCQEMLKTQSPNVVILNAGGLFSKGIFLGGYHYILDSMPMSKTKMDLASFYADEYSTEYGIDRTKALLSAVLPIYQYHDRWDVLTKSSFSHRKDVNLYRKGYLPYSCVWTTAMTIDWMNELVDQSVSPNGWEINVQADGSVQELPKTEPIYAPAINERYWEMVLELDQLCKERNIKLLLMKTPAFGHPNIDGIAWTKLMSNLLKDRAGQNGIEFLDLQYDVDLDIDWSIDAGAGTQHLNYLGAQKVSEYLGRMLQERYGLIGGFCKAYEEDVEIYDTVCRQVKLQLADDLYQYVKEIQKLDDVTLFFSASDDISLGLSDEKISGALNALGLRTNFSCLEYSNAYAAIVEGGAATYESYSNRKIIHSANLKNGTNYCLVSSGFVCGPESKIEISGVNYSMNGRGLNIVVWDNVSGLILDSVVFDFLSADLPTAAIHSNDFRENFLRKYEAFLMEQDAEIGASTGKFEEAVLHAEFKERRQEQQLLMEKSFIPYLERLSEFDKGKYSVFLAVKDIQGFALNQEMCEQLKKLGFDRADTLLEWEYHSFAGVLGDGGIVYQQVGEGDEPSRYEGMVNGHALAIDSMTLHGGNKAYISIDGIDYSIDLRGFNIVVYDNEDGQIVDTVNFDTHIAEIPCTRQRS